MAQGMLGSLPPGLRGWLAADQMNQQKTQNNLGMLSGAMQLQGQQQTQAIQQEALLEKRAQLQRLEQFASQLPASEQARFRIAPMEYIKQMGEQQFAKVNPKDYTPESVAKFSASKNYADLVPARKMDVLPSGEVADLFNAQPGSRFDVTTPHQRFQQNTQFPWQQNVDAANINNAGQRIGIDRANLFHNTGMAPMGGGAGLPQPLPVGSPATNGQPLAPAPMRPRPQPQPGLGVVPPRGAPAAPQNIVPTDAPMGAPGQPPAPQLPPRQAAEIAQKEAEKKSEYSRTLQTYVAARDGLLQGLEGASTGPIVGLVPPMRTEEQIAQGGVASMAPVLKQIFRVAGEGTFTDRDQALLMDMVPTRTDTPEARIAKMKNIDQIISAKLGMPVPENVGATVRAMGIPYEPEKYEYRIDGGKVQRKKK